MKIAWEFDCEDVAKVKAFYDQHSGNEFVKRRSSTNLRDEKPPVTKDAFWEVMVGCLLTTQQRSGPDSPSTRFLNTKPFPLDLEGCTAQQRLADHATTTLATFGGFRRSVIIGRELEANMKFLKGGGWEETLLNVDEVRANSTPTTEKRAADFIACNFKGFGHKQSRNLLQGLGVSRFEIPIDSRIIKWLNSVGFPVKLSSEALQDRNYYNFVSDGFQELCRACDLVPCILDAAIFSSFDEGKWSEDNVVW